MLRYVAVCEYGATHLRQHIWDLKLPHETGNVVSHGFNAGGAATLVVRPHRRRTLDDVEVPVLGRVVQRTFAWPVFELAFGRL